MRTYSVGDRVVFRGEWPWTSSTGVVVGLGERPRQLGLGSEQYVVVHWCGPVGEKVASYRAPDPTVPTWNARLERLPLNPVCVACFWRDPVVGTRYCRPCQDELREMVDEVTGPELGWGCA